MNQDKFPLRLVVISVDFLIPTNNNDGFIIYVFMKWVWMIMDKW